MVGRLYFMCPSSRLASINVREHLVLISICGKVYMHSVLYKCGSPNSKTSFSRIKTGESDILGLEWVDY